MTTTTINDELTSLVREMYGAFNSGERDAWSGRISRRHEPTGIGTDPHEFWVGQQVIDVTDAQLEEMSAAGVSLHPGNIRTASQGDVAWAVDEPTLRMPDGTQLALRLTVVAAMEDGQLRWSHFHLSAGVPNSEALDLDLTT